MHVLPEITWAVCIRTLVDKFNMSYTRITWAKLEHVAW